MSGFWPGRAIYYHYRCCTSLECFSTSGSVHALISQLLSFGTFLVTTAALLALWGGQRPVIEAGGWVGGFLALHLRTGLNMIGTHLLLVPVLLMSFMGMTRVTLSDTGVGIFAQSYALIIKSYTLLRQLGGVFKWFEGLLPRLAWERPELPDPELEIVPTKRTSRKESVTKKSSPAILLEEEEEEASLPPIIITEPAPSPIPVAKTERSKPAPVKAFSEAVTANGRPYVLPAVSLIDPPVRLAVKVDEDALHASSRILENKLGDFGVEGKVVAVRPGPVITTYEFEPAPGR